MVQGLVKAVKLCLNRYFLAGWKSELAGCRSTLSMSKIKVKISVTKYRSFYKTLLVTRYQPYASSLYIKQNKCNNLINYFFSPSKIEIPVSIYLSCSSTGKLGMAWDAIDYCNVSNQRNIP